MGFLGGLLGFGASTGGDFGTSGTSNPGQWLVDLFGGMMTTSGIRVTPELAMTVPGIASAVNVIAEDLAKVPLLLYRRTGDGRNTIATEHPLFGLLNSNPSPWLSSYVWRRAIIGAAMARGNSFTRVLRNWRGEVVRFTPMRPGRCRIRWTDEGEPFFDALDQTAAYRLGYQEVIHMPYRADLTAGLYGGVAGVSPIARHPEAIALALAAERFAGAFFRNGARPSMVVEMDKQFPNDKVADRVRASIERAFSGLDNAFKVAVLELGLKLKEASFNNSDAQLVEVRKEAAVTCCQMFGVPPHKVGILDRATFSNIENQGIDYVTGPISAMASAVESAIETACLTTAERGTYNVRFDLNGLLRGDIFSRYRAYAIGRQWGWLNADEIRQFENFDPLPDGAGKTYLNPLNMVPAGKGGGGSGGGSGDGGDGGAPPSVRYGAAIGAASAGHAAGDAAALLTAEERGGTGGFAALPPAAGLREIEAILQPDQGV